MCNKKLNFFGVWGVREWKAYVLAHLTTEQKDEILKDKTHSTLDCFVNDFRKSGGRKHPYQTIKVLFAQRRKQRNRQAYLEAEERMNELLEQTYLKHC